MDAVSLGCAIRRRGYKSALFEVLQAGVEHAFDPVEFAAPYFLHLFHTIS
jgi:hypothetical protein